MDYHAIAHFAQSWGLIGLFLLFVGAVVYALWPANKSTFERAGRAPLEEDGNGPE